MIDFPERQIWQEFSELGFWSVGANNFYHNAMTTKIQTADWDFGDIFTAPPPDGGGRGEGGGCMAGNLASGLLVSSTVAINIYTPPQPLYIYIYIQYIYTVEADRYSTIDSLQKKNRYFSI